MTVFVCFQEVLTGTIHALKTIQMSRDHVKSTRCESKKHVKVAGATFTRLKKLSWQIKTGKVLN